MRDSEDERLVESATPDAGAGDADDDAPVPEEDPNDFEAHDDEADESIDKAVDLGDRERCARSFAIRRAIEQRMEQKALDDDLDCLDCDLDD